jgi:hypothetical protein
MWMYSGPSSPDHPFSKELGDTKISTQICRVLTHRVILNLGTGAGPLREGVDSSWVTLLEPTFGYLCQSWFLSVLVSLRMVLCVLALPHEGHLT